MLFLTQYTYLDLGLLPLPSYLLPVSVVISSMRFIRCPPLLKLT